MGGSCSLICGNAFRNNSSDIRVTHGHSCVDVALVHQPSHAPQINPSATSVFPPSGNINVRCIPLIVVDRYEWMVASSPAPNITMV